MKNFTSKLLILLVFFLQVSTMLAAGGTPPPPAPPPPPGAPIDTNIFLVGAMMIVYTVYFLNKRIVAKR